MSTLRENEDYFRTAESTIRNDAPANAHLVLVSNREVVGYYEAAGDAAAAWAGQPGAIIKPLDAAPARLVASNYLRHTS